MKVTVIANISVNGRLLLSDDPAHQLPKGAMNFYLQFAHKVGNLVVGLKTFQNFLNFPQEVKDLFKGIEIVVLTDKPSLVKGYKFVNSPDEAIDYMAAKGVEEIAVGGGVGTFNAFLDQELVTDIYFNINPLLTGSGGIIGTNKKLNTKFKIIENQLNDGFIQLYLTKL